jgi:Zn finger protein HypA/HybF involved in hydrogenase expression
MGKIYYKRKKLHCTNCGWHKKVSLNKNIPKKCPVCSSLGSCKIFELWPDKTNKFYG